MTERIYIPRPMGTAAEIRADLQRQDAFGFGELVGEHGGFVGDVIPGAVK